MVIRQFIFVVSLFLFIGCGENTSPIEVENHSSRQIQFNNIEVEIISLPDFNTSTIGFSELKGDVIYFGDQKQREVFAYMPELDSIRKVLGHGRGPREHSGVIDAMTYNGDELCIVSDIVISKYRMDSTGWFNLSSEFIARSRKNDDKEMAERPEVYTKLYDKLRCREYKDTIYLSIAGNHPAFNPFIPRYFDKTRQIKGVPMQKDGREFIFGWFSPAMKKQRGRYSFFMFDFDIDSDGNICVTGELDSIIYKYNHTFNAVQSWGNAGVDMDFREHELFSMSIFKANYLKERRKAHYRKIKCVGEYLFRSYVKNLSNECDGLQIYKGTTLIADVKVPKGLNVIGKIGDWYYSELVGDEENMKMWVYRFKI